MGDKNLDAVNLPKIIVLGIDGLEYNLVEEWRLKNIMQETYCKTDLSEYRVIVTPPIWGSMLTGKIDEDIIDIWVKQSELTGGGVYTKQKWWVKIGDFLPASVNFWIWDNILEHLIGGDAFGKTANYVRDNNEHNIFQFFEKTWTNGIPSYGRNVCGPIQKELTEKAISGEKTPYRKFILKQYQEDKSLLFSAIDRQEYEFIFWYTPMLDNLGHMDMGNPLGLMMKHYLEINKLVGSVKERCPNSIIYIISDHGMERMDPKKSAWGMHTNYSFFSSNTEETIDKPFQLYDLISKHKSD